MARGECGLSYWGICLRVGSRWIPTRWRTGPTITGLGGKSYADLVKSDAVHDMVGEYVATLKAESNRWETIKKWELLDHEPSIEGGELTASLKVKRSVVEKQNKELLDSFYS